MITNTDKKIINEITTIKQLKPKTQKGLATSIKLYTTATGSTLAELIQEAEAEEENGTPPRKRQIKKHFITYQIYLKNHGYKNSTIRAYIARIKSVYNFYEITPPRVQPVKVELKENFKEIPTRAEIKKALKVTNIKNQALILFMATSGAGRAECCNLTIKDFIHATKDYHTGGPVIEILRQLKGQEVVPTWYIKRQKTGVNYYTFNTPEATENIILMLEQRLMQKEIKANNLLFELQPQTVAAHFKNINEACGFGTVDGRRRFRPHALRKYFSTTLFSAGADNLTIDFLLGHKIKGVQAAYIKANPEAQKEKYIKYLQDLSINVIYEGGGVEELEELREFKRDSLERIKRLEEMVRALSVTLE